MTQTSPTTPLQATWQRLAPREQTLVLAASALVSLALLWWLLVAPALRTVQGADAQHAQLNAQLEHMQSLQTQAQQLQAQPRTPPADAARTLQASVVQTLGSGARLALQGDRATLTVQGVSATALASWLAQARSNARATPQEAHLTRSTAAPAGVAPPAARWDGTLVLSLPAP